MPEIVCATLAEHLARHGPGPAGLVFTNTFGRPLRRNTVGDMWHRAALQANLPAWATFHDLRHFYASLLISRGCSVKTVQKRLGHQSAMEIKSSAGSWLSAELVPAAGTTRGRDGSSHFAHGADVGLDRGRGSVVAILATCGDRRKQLSSRTFSLPPMTEVYSRWPTSRVTFVSRTESSTRALPARHRAWPLRGSRRKRPPPEGAV